MLSFLPFGLTMCGFVYFFYAIGVWPLAVFCFLILLGFVGGNVGTDALKQGKQQITDLLQENGLMVARILLVLGCGILLLHFNIPPQTVILIFLLIHLGLRILSHFGFFKDGKKTFGITYVLILLGSMGWLLYESKGMTTGIQYEYRKENTLFLILAIILSLIPFHLGVYAFLHFIGMCLGKSDQKVQHVTHILFHLTIIIAFLVTTKNITLFRLLMAQAYLTCIYYITYYFRNTTSPSKEITITAEDILAGKKIFDYIGKKKKEANAWRGSISTFFIIPTSSGIKSILYVGNAGLMLIGMGIYLSSWKAIALQTQVLYWISTIIFLINSFLIKKVNQKLDVIHRFLQFVAINAVVYASVLFFAGTSNRNTLAFSGILRNYINGILVTKIEAFVQKGFLMKKDYRLWVGTNIICMLINCFLLTKTTLPGEVIFALVCIYLGSFGFLSYSGVRYIFMKNESKA